MVVRRTILFVFFLLISLIAIYMMVIAINSIEKRGAYDAPLMKGNSRHSPSEIRASRLFVAPHDFPPDPAHCLCLNLAYRLRRPPKRFVDHKKGLCRFGNLSVPWGPSLGAACDKARELGWIV